MHRFFEKNIDPGNREIILNDENSRHITNVIRLRPGEEIIVCDGKSRDFLCAIKDAGKRTVAGVVSVSENLNEPKIETILFQALPKSDKMDIIIQKCTELGVAAIVPVISERGTSRPKDSGIAAKLSRYQKISEAAAKQSGRGIIPGISDIVTLKESISELKRISLTFVAYENERENFLKSALKRFKGDSIGIFIGPEGGFSEQEIKFLTDNGVEPVSFGGRILRTETAGMYFLACLNYEFENSL